MLQDPIPLKKSTKGQQVKEKDSMVLVIFAESEYIKFP